MILEESSWQTKSSKSYPQLLEKIEADVVIVGAGITGIFNAYILSQAGLKVVVLEKDEQILNSTTMYTTAFITQALDSSFSELVRLFGSARAKLVWQSGREAIELITEIVRKEKIDCEFKIVSGYTYVKVETGFAGLAAEHDAVKKAGFEANLSKDGSKLNFPNSGFLEIPKQAQFHPIKFAQALAERAETLGAKIFTNSKALSIEASTVTTETGQVTAKDVLIATYYPLTQEGTKYKKAIYISYVYELEIPKGLILEGLYFDTQNPYHYFRIDSFEKFDRMIVGGEDHRKEIRMNPEKNYRALEKYVKDVLGAKAYKLRRKWSGRILEPSDGLALIGQIKPHTYLATAFSGSGMTYAPISAMIIRDLILGQPNIYSKLYNPLRNPSLKQLFIKGSDYVGEFFGGAVKNIFS